MNLKLGFKRHGVLKLGAFNLSTEYEIEEELNSFMMVKKRLI